MKRLTRTASGYSSAAVGIPPECSRGRSGSRPVVKCASLVTHRASPGVIVRGRRALVRGTPPPSETTEVVFITVANKN
ncbi:unnamed protein product [Leptosia nina]|uniref:Uncharacterized protein n=1 Tax=Leptosia nina TaxID=320188 RepID=A0AAV1JD80_9NEOP